MKDGDEKKNEEENNNFTSKKTKEIEIEISDDKKVIENNEENQNKSKIFLYKKYSKRKNKYNIFKFIKF